MAELRGKGWRVLGYFVWMLGAGIVLDSPRTVLGTLILVGGAALYVMGANQSEAAGREAER